MQRNSLFTVSTRTALVMSILLLALGFSVALNIQNNPLSRTASAQSASPKLPSNFENLFADMAKNLSPAVVHITSEMNAPAVEADSGDDNSMPMPFGFQMPPMQRQPQRPQQATGTGVIVRSDGYVLTNDHVVGGADRVTVRLSDGREFKGKVFRDPRTDLALVKIEAKDLPYAGFADSEKARVGQWVMAIGNPFGYDNTVTVGVISGLSREFSVPDPGSPMGGKFYPDAIQTDASINPGNSGGPLVDTDGKVIGITSAILSESGGNMGIGFAVPSRTCKFVMDQLITKGKVVRGFLGLMPSNLTPVLAQKLGAKDGALVQSVDPDSPADKGGIKVKDVITNIGGKDIRNAIDLRHTVETFAPNTDVKITVIREKQEKSLTVKLGQAPSGTEEPTANPADKVGMNVQPLTDDTAKSLNLPNNTKGVVVTSVAPGGAAQRAGIRQGDVITEIDDAAITGVASFSKAISKVKSGDTAILVVMRGNRSTIIELTLD